MNTSGWYKTQDPGEVGAQLEELVRRDAGAVEPLPYSASEVANAGTSKSQLLADALVHGAGGQPLGLFNVTFQLPYPGHAVLTASINRNLHASYCAYLRYQVYVPRSIDTEVALERGKPIIRAARFLGGHAAERLNAVPGLAKRADGILETKIVVGMGTLEADPVFRLVPVEGGAWLMVGTLPNQKPGLKAPKISTNAGEILRIAADLAAAL